MDTFTKEELVKRLAYLYKGIQATAKIEAYKSFFAPNENKQQAQYNEAKEIATSINGIMLAADVLELDVTPQDLEDVEITPAEKESYHNSLEKSKSMSGQKVEIEVDTDSGSLPEAVRKAVEQAKKDYPNAEIHTIGKHVIN